MILCYNVDTKKTDVATTTRSSVNNLEGAVYMNEFNIEKEIWKDISGFEGHYQVSDKGRVRSLDRKVWDKRRDNFRSRKGKVLKPGNNLGYWYVILSKEGKSIIARIHRLVAEAFLTNPEKLEYINHKDENKSNNSLENLEWCTPKYNAYYGKNSKIRPVMATNVTTGKKTVYPSMMEAERLGGFGHASISAVCRGKQKTYKNHYWKYLEEV